MYTDNWTELYHHGIKGQKHGKRRYQNPDGSLTPEGRVHYGVGERRAKAVAGVGTAVAGAGLVNAGLLGIKRASTKEAINYYNKATTVTGLAKATGTFSEGSVAAAKSFATQEAKKYTAQLLALPALSSPAVVAPIAIGGAAALAGLGYIGYKKYQQYKANKGTSVKHCDLSEFDEDTLCHFGIPGQKWGIRRYQNPDGSLTPEGREHYGINGTKNAKEADEVMEQYNKEGKYYHHYTTKGLSGKTHYIEEITDPKKLKDSSREVQENRIMEYKNIQDYEKAGYKVDPDTGGDYAKKEIGDNTTISVAIPEDLSEESKQKALKNARQAEKDIQNIRSTTFNFKEHDLGTVGKPVFSKDPDYDYIHAIVSKDGNEYTRDIKDSYDGEFLGPVDIVKLNNKWVVKDLLSDKEKRIAKAQAGIKHSSIDDDFLAQFI